METISNTQKRVLIVDDEKAILRVFQIKLRISGFDVITAPGGQEALDLVTSESPDIMLLDVVMPGIDGFEVLKKLRTYSALPVIVFSAWAENIQKALSLGANDFISKPFNPDQLVEKIRSVLTRTNHEKNNNHP
jgi:DNA-binding response OmpR family regulator